MITDINRINKELNGFEEVESVYDIHSNAYVKYLTLKDNREAFYLGGVYLKMGDNKIYLYNGGNTWCIPLFYKRKNASIYYRTRLFIKDNRINNVIDASELQSTIDKQQDIINKLLLKKHSI